tara:strand:+ start:167 stop:337 length:171 start_codon:yes stop_codon:yes gene_type:complete
MDWSNLRGKALEKPKKDNLNLKLLEFRIINIVREELKEFNSLINIDKNKYGKWDYI